MRYRVYIVERSQNNVSRLICGAVVYRDGNTFNLPAYGIANAHGSAAAGVPIGTTWSECRDGIWERDEYQNRFAVPESNQFFNMGVLQEGVGIARLTNYGYTRAQGLVIRYLRSLKSK